MAVWAPFKRQQVIEELPPEEEVFDLSALKPPDPMRLQRLAERPSTPILTIKDLHVHYQITEETPYQELCKRLRHRTLMVPQRESSKGKYFWSHGLRGVSIEFPREQITALIGPSGCGKSSLLRAINRMHEVSHTYTHVEGDILHSDWDGEVRSVLSDLDPIEVRSRIAMIFQKPNVVEGSIFDNVAYGLRLKFRGRISRVELAERVEEALKDVSLWEEVKARLNDPAKDLSGGQQQRLCIARALIVDPEIILMDEPCSALDPISTSKIEELMIDMAEKGKTVIIVTHNLPQASRVSQRTGFFEGGELVELTETEKIFITPTNKRTEEYITGRYG